MRCGHETWKHEKIQVGECAACMRELIESCARLDCLKQQYRLFGEDCPAARGEDLALLESSKWCVVCRAKAMVKHATDVGGR